MNELLAIVPFAAPVALAAIGEVVGQKSGVINIGLEGMMLLGAYLALVGSTLGHGASAIALGLAFGVMGAALLALVSGVFTVNLATDQVVVGTAINLFVIGLTGTLFRARYGGSGALLSVPTLSRFWGFDAVTVFMVLSIPCVSLLLNKTNWGLAVRSAGEYPKAAEAAGLSVIALRLSALVVGGMFAGLAGAYLVLGTVGSFAENMTSGRGFVAIALVTFGRWRTGWVFAAALLMGFLESLQFKFQAGGVHISYQLLLALPYVVALGVLVVFGKGALAPAALGRPYRRER